MGPKPLERYKKAIAVWRLHCIQSFNALHCITLYEVGQGQLHVTDASSTSKRVNFLSFEYFFDKKLTLLLVLDASVKGSTFCHLNTFL